MSVYLCGGIMELNDSQCNDWREEATKLLTTDTINPMRRDFRGLEGNFTREIVEGDLIDILNSEFILVNACRPSWGTAMEIGYAYVFHKKIVAFTDTESKISPWLRYHCDSLHTSLQEACQYINNYGPKTARHPNH